ncbi:MAG: alpha/beta hydrolase, partial [Pseudomonadota bacterium]
MKNFQFIETNGVQLRVAVDGSETGPLIVLAHGFPESWFSWRHQIPVLAEAGYHVAAPDIRGYGGSDQPADIAAYAIKEMTADMAGLVDELSPDDPAIIIGHDWGAPIAWNSALLHPDHFRAVAGMAIPHAPMGDQTILDVTKKHFIDKNLFFYLHYFQEPGRAEAEFEADTAQAIHNFYFAWSGDAPDDFFRAKPADAKMFEQVGEIPDKMGDWFPPAVEAYYVSEFERAGWSGALNRYRNFERDHAMLTSLDSQVIDQPSMFMIGSSDTAMILFPGDLETRLKAGLSDLRSVHILEGCG